MSHTPLISNTHHSKTHTMSYQCTYQFNPSIYSQTVNKSNHNISYAALRTLSPDSKKRSNFSYKGFKFKNYTSTYLCPSKSNRSLSTEISINNEFPSHKSRKFKRNNNCLFDSNKPFTKQMLEEAKVNINEKSNKIDNIMKYIQTDGFNRNHKEILKRKNKLLSIELKNSCLNSNLKSMRKDENNILVSNGKLYTECSINSQRTKSQERERISKNGIISITVGLTQCEQRIKEETTMSKVRTEECSKLSKETTLLNDKRKTMTMSIAEQQKDNERIRDQIHFFHKRIAAIKEKIHFYFDSNEKSFNNLQRLVTDKSLYY